MVLVNTLNVSCALIVLAPVLTKCKRIERIVSVGIGNFEGVRLTSDADLDVGEFGGEETAQDRNVHGH